MLFFFCAEQAEGTTKRELGDLDEAAAALDLALQLEATKILFFALSSRGAAKRERGDFAGPTAALDLALQVC